MGNSNCLCMFVSWLLMKLLPFKITESKCTACLLAAPTAQAGIWLWRRLSAEVVYGHSHALGCCWRGKRLLPCTEFQPAAGLLNTRTSSQPTVVAVKRSPVWGDFRSLRKKLNGDGQRSATIFEKASCMYSFPVPWNLPYAPHLPNPCTGNLCHLAKQAAILHDSLRENSFTELRIYCQGVNPSLPFIIVWVFLITETYWFARWSQCLLHCGQSNLYQCILKYLLPDSAAVIIILLWKQTKKRIKPKRVWGY